MSLTSDDLSRFVPKCVWMQMDYQVRHVVMILLWIITLEIYNILRKIVFPLKQYRQSNNQGK